MQAEYPPVTIKRIEQAVMLASSAVLAGSLALFAWAGLAARYWADDYCYGAWVRVYGLPGAVVDWYQTSGNRVSTLAAVALGEAFGPRAISVVPLAVLVLLSAAWVVFLSQASYLVWLGRPPQAPGTPKEPGAPKERSVPQPFVQHRAGSLRWLWVALAQVYFLALLAPDRLQTIYWRMGSLHYSLPLALLLFNLALLAWAARQPGRVVALAALSGGALAFFAAGFSETFAALQAGLFGLMLLAAAGWRFWSTRGARRTPVLQSNRSQPWRAAKWLLAALPLAGTLVMMAVMASAPANAWRQAVMPPPDNLLMVVPYALQYAFDFIIASLASRPVPYALFMLGMAAFGMLALPGDAGSARWLQPKKAWPGPVLSLLAAYALIVCSFAPSAYAGLQYPAGRAQMPAAFILLAGLGLAAGWGGALLQRLLIRWVVHARQASAAVIVRAAALLLLAAFSLYPLRMAAIPLAERADLAARAERWDARDEQIRAALAGGAREVQVRQVDVVQSLEDLGPDPTHWINACAALYYQAGSITALP